MVKRKLVATLISMVVVLSAGYMMARCVFLSPLCYSDNAQLDDQENDYIKKILLEAVKNRCSVFAAGEAETSGCDDEALRKIFILINSDFMDSVEKVGEYEYVARIQTYFVEEASADCVYEFQIVNGQDGYQIVSWGLDL